MRAANTKTTAEACLRVSASKRQRARLGGAEPTSSDMDGGKDVNNTALGAQNGYVADWSTALETRGLGSHGLAPLRGRSVATCCLRRLLLVGGYLRWRSRAQMGAQQARWQPRLPPCSQRSGVIVRRAAVGARARPASIAQGSTQRRRVAERSAARPEPVHAKALHTGWGGCGVCVVVGDRTGAVGGWHHPATAHRVRTSNIGPASIYCRDQRTTK